MYQTKTHTEQVKTNNTQNLNITKPILTVDPKVTEELYSYTTINNNIFIGFAIFAVGVFCIALFSLML